MIKRMGNWAGIGRAINNLAKDIENVQLEELRQLGLKAEKKAVEHLQKQDLGWKPLEPKTLKAKTTNKKGKRRRSEKILIDSSSYFDSITSWAVGKRVYVGVKREAKHKVTRTPIANIAAVHEYGSKARNIPARPLWQPVMKSMKGEVAKRKGFGPAIIEYWKRKL